MNLASEDSVRKSYISSDQNLTDADGKISLEDVMFEGKIMEETI